LLDCGVRESDVPEGLLQNAMPYAIVSANVSESWKVPFR
jgi:hypothetical protein